jgi:(2Fe-2S) ferredoxin
MPPPYTRHVFVCLHDRGPGHPKGSCAQKGSEDLLSELKGACKARGLEGVRVNKAGCLDNCEQGVSIVVYPEATWYGHVQKSDIPDLVKHIAGGQPVERLRVDQAFSHPAKP